MFKKIISEAKNRLYAFFFPAEYKKYEELNYWKGRQSAEGVLGNSHYQPLYTDAFGLSPKDYEGKRVLDIGCGPRGSLEWADMTARRVGLDPLVPEYLKLGADLHKMEYVAADSSKIPFDDAYFDVVTCLNALDHVDNFEGTVREIKRVTKCGGLFLLSVEIDHPPTPAEPVTIDDLALEKFTPEFEVVSQFRVGSPSDHNLHKAVLSRSPEYLPGQPGLHVAKYLRK